MELTRPGDTILLLAGKGHNGDDVRAVANHLSEREVSLLSVTDPAKTRQKLPLDLDPAPALVVDGLFGIGLNRPLNADWMQVIAQVNAKRLRVLSVDVPSGVDAATGEMQGAAIRATETLTLGAAKRGLLEPSASEFVGQLRVALDIGLAPCRETSDLLLGQAEDFTGFPPARPAGGHKGTFGHLGIMAGSMGYHGAAVLAARGAARAQPGLVTLLTPDEVFVPVASQLAGVMVRPLAPGEITVKSITGMLIGPGLAADDLPVDLKETAGEMWVESSVPIVVDASALDWLPSGTFRDKAIRVITPHPGEAARLLGLNCRRSAGRPGRGVARSIGQVRQLLGGSERPAHADRERRRSDFGEPHGQPGPWPRRQRRPAGRLSGRTAGPAAVARGCRPDNPLRRLAARRGGGRVGSPSAELGRGRLGQAHRGRASVSPKSLLNAFTINHNGHTLGFSLCRAVRAA